MFSSKSNHCPFEWFVASNQRRGKCTFRTQVASSNVLCVPKPCHSTTTWPQWTSAETRPKLRRILEGMHIGQPTAMVNCRIQMRNNRCGTTGDIGFGSKIDFFRFWGGKSISGAKHRFTSIYSTNCDFFGFRVKKIDFFSISGSKIDFRCNKK